MTDNGNRMHPTAYACKETLAFKDAVPASELRERIDRFLSELTGALEPCGCELVGHIKGLIDAGDKGHLLFSITSFEEGARIKGKMDGGISGAVLTMNAIVYGIEKAVIEEAFQNMLARHFRS